MYPKIIIIYNICLHLQIQFLAINLNYGSVFQWFMHDFASTQASKQVWKSVFYFYLCITYDERAAKGYTSYFCLSSHSILCDKSVHAWRIFHTFNIQLLGTMYETNEYYITEGLMANASFGLCVINQLNVSVKNMLQE